MHNKVKEALGSASYLTYHWRQYSFEQLEKEMVRVCGLCHKALGIPQDDSVTDFERGQWSVIQNIIGYAKDYSLAAQLCRRRSLRCKSGGIVMIQIHKHDKGELYSIYGFFIDPDKDVWVDKKQLMELYNEINKIKVEE